MCMPCCFFGSFVWAITIVEHMSSSNDNAVILCLLVTTMPMVYFNVVNEGHACLLIGLSWAV